MARTDMARALSLDMGRWTALSSGSRLFAARAVGRGGGPLAELPSGTVTFLFTDIEGSTRLLKLLREGYGRVVAEHRELLRAAFSEHRGVEVDSQGDSFFVVFRRAKDAIDAAAAGQRALQSHGWPEGAALRVRIGIHTGQAEASDGRYHGLAVHRAARIMAAAHGGQVLVSQTTCDLLEDEEEESGGIVLRDLGVQRLKDLDRPVRLHQVQLAGLPSEFPPLRTLEPAPPVGPPVEAGRGRRRSWFVPAAAALVVGVAAVAAVALMRGGAGADHASAVAADSVGVFGTPSGSLIAQVPLQRRPNSVAAGLGSVWVTNTDDDSVLRIDPATNVVEQTIGVGNGPAGIAVGGGFVWVANNQAGTVSKIDPRTNSEVQTIRVGNGPSGVAFGEGAVWVANSTDRTVTPIDPGTGRPRSTIRAVAGADGIAVGDGAVWVTSESAGSLTRIDPRAGIVPIPPINVGRGASAVAVVPEAVWVANNLDGTVARVDPTTNQLRATIPVGDGPSGVAVGRDGKTVWVTSELAGTVSRIENDSVRQTLTTGNRPEDVAVSGGRMYVAVRTSGLAHRGGTLTLLSRYPFDSIDPAVVYTTLSWPAIILTNDGLLAYKRVGGTDGTRLVPDLATSIPIPSDDGRAYTFQVRPGIRYSNGALVRPADFRRGLERSIARYADGLGTGFYFSSIVGYGACLKKPKRCDLSKGIVADPASNTVTFHLVAPDPEFLSKLGLPSAYAVPSSTPLKARLPLPATGPYMFASYDEKRGVRLVRNPRFREWYQAAQPGGYPDELVWRFGVLADAQRRAVERGTADLALDPVSPNGGFPSAALLAPLMTRYASQLHRNPLLLTVYIFLNTRLPPFNDVRVRQAVNYAVDRNRIVDLQGGPDVAQPSCQVLPPNIDGYSRFCPYTIQRSPDEKYTGPDLARARRLVAASGTRGEDVAVSGPADFQAHGGDYFVSVLRSLGYQARFRNLDPRRKVQAGIALWNPDYPSASDFFPVVLTCGSFVPRSRLNLNLAEFCNHPVDAEIARARALQATDPGAASRLWSKVDRDVVNQAPWVFLENQRNVNFVSRRVGNYQYNPQWGVLLDQLWVR